MNLFLLLAALAGPSAAAVPSFEVHGHRGARSSRPENTLSAFRFALQAGVDSLELDLNVTKDDVLVVTHDPFLNPAICQTGEGKPLPKRLLIRELTLKELQAYDCGARVHPRFPRQVAQPGERIPTFEAVLEWLAGEKDPRARTVGLNVETKSEEEHPQYAPEPAAFAKLVLDAFRKHGLGKRALLQSFDFRTLREARKIDPSQRISALVEERPGRGQLARIARELKVDVISPNHEWLKERDVRELHAMGVKVVPWTANDEAAWKKLVSLGVDGIISDDPEALLKFRAKLGAGVTER